MNNETKTLATAIFFAIALGIIASGWLEKATRPHTLEVHPAPKTLAVKYRYGEKITRAYTFTVVNNPKNKVWLKYYPGSLTRMMWTGTKYTSAFIYEIIPYNAQVGESLIVISTEEGTWAIPKDHYELIRGVYRYEVLT